jgi:ABC-type transport system involved in multi-copper enzyme maturation permease subunit
MTLLGRLAYYCAGYVLIGVLIAIVSRSVIVGIASFLIIPTTAEPLLSLLLKDNAKYLPFTSLDSTLNVSMLPNTLSPGKAMIVSGAYVAVALVITWILFVRRDAN